MLRSAMSARSDGPRADGRLVEADRGHAHYANDADKRAAKANALNRNA